MKLVLMAYTTVAYFKNKGPQSAKIMFIIYLSRIKKGLVPRLKLKIVLI